ncbi:DUF5789 family protein [Halalkalicoccus subterraneus]|uniref:DUF5789 family protein n=1 Tax=Halalkalicoccus subterraneus TaxID=2675002 RepID=UPI001FE949B3|nr:hypothetical protein [Halalkalicoccus subterraneus]
MKFGSLADDLATCEYPVDCTELIEAYGEATLQLPNGTQSLQNVLVPFEDERFDSQEDVRRAVIGSVNKDGVGREGYSDRTPPALGVDDDREPDSF